MLTTQASLRLHKAAGILVALVLAIVIALAVGASFAGSSGGTGTHQFPIDSITARLASGSN